MPNLDIPIGEKVDMAILSLPDPSPLVRETAFWILTRIDRPPGRENRNDHGSRNLKNGRTKGQNRNQMLTIEKILFLRAVELFNRISDEDMVWIANLANEVFFDPGERFIRQGDPGDSLYIIVSGEVEIAVDNIGIVSKSRERNVIGEMAALSGSRRAANCVAATNVTALKIEREEFLEVVREKPEISLGIIHILAGLVENLNSKLLADSET